MRPRTNVQVAWTSDRAPRWWDFGHKYAADIVRHNRAAQRRGEPIMVKRTASGLTITRNDVTLTVRRRPL